MKPEKAESTVVIEHLKNFGIPGDQANYFYGIKGPDYLIRKCYEYEYRMTHGDKVKRGWLIRSIQDDYDPPESFWEWFKFRKEQTLHSSVPDELKKIVGRL
jgi:predicted adenine nucleotide alpha hydrolase (AANH) superfamily ATPase